MMVLFLLFYQMVTKKHILRLTVLATIILGWESDRGINDSPKLRILMVSIFTPFIVSERTMVVTGVLVLAMIPTMICQKGWKSL